jgi:hypothetical protein
VVRNNKGECKMASASKCLANSGEVEKSLALRRAVEIIMEEALLKLLLKELPKREEVEDPRKSLCWENLQIIEDVQGIGEE